MPDVIDNLRSVLARPRRPRTVHECRHCGTAVDGSTAVCPACDGSEIACYEL